MPFNRDFHAKQKLPADYTRALEQFIGLFSNLQLHFVSSTVLGVAAGAGNEQVSLGIEGLWRFIEAEVRATHPGGAAGSYDIVVATTANIFTSGVEEEEDHTDYAFTLHIEKTGVVPSGEGITATRKIGELTWNGTEIVALIQLVGATVGALSGPLAPGAKSGDLRFTARAALEEGWLWCEGQAVSRTTYKALFEAIGTAYGTGNGSTTFNIPDYRGRVPMGVGTGSGLSARTRGEKTGEEKHKLTTGELAAHAHGVEDPGHRHRAENADYFICGPEGGGLASAHLALSGDQYAISNETAIDSTGISLANTGGGEAHNNIQPSTVCNVWIKT